MHPRPDHSKWQRFALTVCLFALSVLAPMIWHEVQSYRAANQDPTAARIMRDADRRLGFVGAHPCDPEMSPPQPLGAWARTADAPTVSLASLQEPMAGRVGQWRLHIERAETPDQEDEDLSDTPAPSMQDGTLLDFPAGPLALETTEWAAPAQLVKALQELAAAPLCREWSLETAKLVESLPAANPPREMEGLFRKLRRQLPAVDGLLTQVKSAAPASQLRRARHALERRLDVWQSVHELKRPSAKFAGHAYHFERLSTALDGAQSFVDKSSDSAGWSAYLMLAELHQLAGGDSTTTPEQAAQILRRAVGRFRARGLWARQRRVLRSPQLAALKTELLRLLDEPVDTTRLLAMLEAYESDGRISVAEEIGEVLGRLSRSARPAERQLASQLERHYRGANMRLSLSEQLLARMLPPDDPQVRTVNETIMGYPISGVAASRTEMRARLLPSSRDVLRVELLAYGSVDSDTMGSAGSVTTFTQTESRYVLSKLLEFRNDGIERYPARVQWVQANTQLNELRTRWDGVPLVADIARSLAANRYSRTAPERKSEVERRLAERALREFEARAARGISRMNMDYVRQVIVPLYRLELEPDIVAEPFQEDRMTARFRLANELQLGSHTPRPRAVSNCLASLQLHESLLNNVMEQLALGGRTLTGAELQKYINAKFNVRLRMEPKPADKSEESDALPSDQDRAENAERVRFTFAQQDPLRTRLVDGQLVLTVSLEQLEAGGRRWRNFRLVVPYEVRPVDSTVELVQVGETGVIGRISSRSQIILRGIMTNIFEKGRSYRFFDQFMADPRLAGTRIVQAEITDGWLALSLNDDSG
jgi:hypothetical protein